ncbi:MAG: Gfo/Idh/MocA family oxidoreductase [Verrucomicrobiota bacterium]
MNEVITNPSRRSFLTKSTIGAGLALGAPAILKAKEAGAPTDDIRVGFIGCGKQHEVLLNAMMNIPGLRYVAASDIMRDRVGRTFSTIKGRFDTSIKRYIDAGEMLEKEELDAVFITTPDFWHAPHTIMALEAGCNVYCEKMMSNTIEGARSMVHAAEKSGKLCQIGHQRRSNPRYLFTYNELFKKHGVTGQIVNMNGQWNRALSSSGDIGMNLIDNPKKHSMLPNAETLKKYGFDTGADRELSQKELWHRFYNWRFYLALSGGPISDLGAHQIDTFNWFMGVQPKSVMASGGRSFFKDREHFDNVMCIFDYDSPQGNARAFYQVLTTTSAGGGYYESFMGTNGTVEISEREAYTNIYKESGANNSGKWDELVQRGVLKKVAAGQAAGGADAIASYESAPPDEYGLPGGLNKPPHQPHIENFLGAIRGNNKLNCDARHAFEAEAPIYWVNPAAERNEIINFTDEHLQA